MVAVRPRPRTGGFWKGLAAGLLLAALALLALAILFPPTRYFAPSVPGGASLAPAAPAAPADGPLAPPTPGPLIGGQAAPPLVPGLGPPPAAPVAETPAAGSSLTPLK